MNAIAPRRARRARERSARHARVRDERQDDDHPAPRDGARRRRPSCHQQLDRREPGVGHRSDAGDRGRPGRRRARGRRARAAAGRRLAGCRAAGARQPEPRPAGSLRRGARGRRQLAHGGREPSRARDRRQRVRSQRGVGGRTGEGHVGRARAGLAFRRRDLPVVRCAARVVGRSLRLPALDRRVRLRAARHAEPARRQRARARRPALSLAGRAPGSMEPRQRRAGGHRGRAARRRPGGGCRRDGDGDERGRPVHDGSARRRARGARAARQEPGGLDRGAALPRRPRHVRRDRRERAGRRRQGPVVAVGRAVRAAAGPADRGMPASGISTSRCASATRRSSTSSSPTRSPRRARCRATCTSSPRTRSSRRCTASSARDGRRLRLSGDGQ